MVVASHPDQLPSPSAPELLRRGWNRAVRRFHENQLSWILGLCVASVLIGVAMSVWDDVIPVGALVIPLVVANIVLGPRTLPWFVIFVFGVLVVAVATTASTSLDTRRVGGIVIEFIVGLVILVSSFRRSSLGVAGSRGEEMLVDLRDRISKQGQLPVLPCEWYAEAVTRSAGGSSFAGDFMVASRSPEGSQLQVAVVDVSGKGEQAGTRSLLLSGAFGGLLGALPPDRFLPAANDYLLQQDWSEGFATAVHLALDLSTGRFELRSAGHPPGLQLHAGSGRWGIHEVEGPILGLMTNAEFGCATGTLQSGDALLLYTDGLVETPERDISLGIDKLLGQAERLLRNGFDRGARRLVDQVASMNDDRALLLLHRH